MNFQKILSYCLRIVNKNRAYSVINLLGLSSGLIVFTLIVLFVRYEFGYDRYHENYDKIYRIARSGEGEYMGSNKFLVSAAPIAGAIRETVKGAELVTRIWWRTNALINTEGKSFLESQCHAADPDFFKIFSFDVIAGESEGLLMDDSDVVLTESVAIKYYGSVENAIGKSLSVETNMPLGDYVVQSVVRDMPYQSHFRVDIVFPFEKIVRTWQERDLTQWNNNNYFIYFTLQPGTDVAEGEKQLNAYVSPKLGDYEVPPVCIFQPVSDTHLGERMNFDLGVVGSKDQLYVFLCIGVLVLIIACINYINMATARAANRAKEIGVRKVNGALRWDLIVQFMFEAIFLVMVAALVAGLAVYFLLPSYNDFLGKQIQLDDSLWFLLPVIIIVGFISGAYPALLFSSFKPIQVLKGRFKQSHNSRLRNVLVVFQFVVSGTLVFSTLIVWKQMQFVKNKDIGFNREHIMTVRMRDKELGARYEEIRQVLLKHPGISKVSGSMSLPTGIRSSQGRDWKGKTGELHRSVYINQADPNFIDLYEIPLLAGSNLKPNGNRHDAIVNETLVRELGYSNDEIVGMQFNFRHDTTRVVGVIGDFHYGDFTLKIEPLEMKTFEWGSPSYLSIKTETDDLQSVIDYTEKTLAGFSEKYPFEYSFYDEVYSKTFMSEAKTSKLMTVFSIVAIVIAALGLYGLILHMVNQRMKEIGIRKTLGAGSWSIVKLLSGKFGILILTGYAIACCIGYYGIEKWLEGFAYRISPGVGEFVATLFAIVLIATIAVFSRVAIALRINPAMVLRQDG